MARSSAKGGGGTVRTRGAGGQGGAGASSAYRQLTAMLDRLVEQWSRERPDLDIRHKEIVYAIYILQSLFQRNADAALQPWGLNFSSYGVLATLRRSGTPYELAPTELAQLLGFTAGGMSNLIARLEEHELVRRTQHDTDRRCVRVRLTPKGKRVVDEAATAVTAAESRYFASMPATERRQLYRGLRRLIDTFAG